MGEQTRYRGKEFSWRVFILVLFAPAFLMPLYPQDQREASRALQATVVPSEGKPELASIVIEPKKWIFRSGDGIPVTVTLTAGPKGVYLARGFSVSMGNVPGFSIWLETPGGQFAQTCGAGGEGDFGAPMPTPSQILKREFVFLKPGEQKKFEGGVECPTKAPGQYRIMAKYSPNYPYTDKVAQLPETRGLLLTQAITADPVTIEIRK